MGLYKQRECVRVSESCCGDAGLLILEGRTRGKIREGVIMGSD